MKQATLPERGLLLKGGTAMDATLIWCTACEAHQGIRGRTGYRAGY